MTQEEMDKVNQICKLKDGIAWCYGIIGFCIGCIVSILTTILIIACNS